MILGSLHSPDYTPGSEGWTINRDGSAEFNDVTVRGKIEDGQFFLYDGTPTLGNLLLSISPSIGTDEYGNEYPFGLSINSGSVPNAFSALFSFIQNSGQVTSVLGIAASAVTIGLKSFVQASLGDIATGFLGNIIQYVRQTSGTGAGGTSWTMEAVSDDGFASAIIASAPHGGPSVLKGAVDNGSGSVILDYGRTDQCYMQHSQKGVTVNASSQATVVFPHTFPNAADFAWIQIINSKAVAVSATLIALTSSSLTFEYQIGTGRAPSGSGVTIDYLVMGH